MNFDTKNNPQWKTLESTLKELSNRLKSAQIYIIENEAFSIEYYFCHSVMELSQVLRTQTKALQLGSQHHILKILFKYLKFGESGILEYPIRDNRVDIYLEHENKIIEVKTITQMTIHKLYQKILGVLESESSHVDILWVFFFYKLKEASPIAPNCQYLLTFISIDLLEVERESLKWDLTQMIDESKIHIAEKLKITPEIIIPLDNLIKVEDLEREIADKDQQLADKDQQLAQLRTELQELKKKLGKT